MVDGQPYCLICGKVATDNASESSWRRSLWLAASGADSVAVQARCEANLSVISVSCGFGDHERDPAMIRYTSVHIELQYFYLYKYIYI